MENNYSEEQEGGTHKSSQFDTEYRFDTSPFIDNVNRKHNTIVSWIIIVLLITLAVLLITSCGDNFTINQKCLTPAQQHELWQKGYDSGIIHSDRMRWEGILFNARHNGVVYLKVDTIRGPYIVDVPKRYNRIHDHIANANGGYYESEITKHLDRYFSIDVDCKGTYMKFETYLNHKFDTVTYWSGKNQLLLDNEIRKLWAN
jgi:hypothetical protein